MNLFENLQMLNESENKLVSEFRDFLKNKNAQYIVNEIDETKDGMQIVIYDGDWKHEHLYMQRLINEFFKNKGIDVSITSEEIGESDQDTYSARYDIIFNAESKEYKMDVKTEDINNIRYQVTCQLAISNEEIYSEHATLKDAIASARKAQQSFMNVKIKDLEDGNSWYNIDDAEQDLNDGLYEGKYYGGAYDISDTAYFTRDDLDEFSNEVIEQLSNATHGDIIANVVDCYLDEDTNELELTVSYGEYEHTHKEKIDMRKIKVPKDLIKAYSHKFVNDFLWSFIADTEHEEMIKESIDLSEYEYIGPATGYNKGWSLYRKIVDGKGVWVAKHQQTKEVVPINYDQVRGFEPIKLQGIQKLQKDLGDMLLPKNEFVDSDIKLTPLTYEDIKQQLEEIDTHKFLKINIDNSPNLNNTKASIIGTLINGEPICFYDSSFLKTQSDIDFFKEQYAKASKEIDNMRKRGYLGVKDESFKIEETGHNEILDIDYATGEKLFNAIKDYLDSLDQISMDGEDYNWQPSEFNAKNLEADGEIYLVNGTYILFYPYINEWSDNEFKVIVMEASDLNIMIKNGITNIFNKYKTDKWKLVFEG